MKSSKGRLQGAPALPALPPLDWTLALQQQLLPWFSHVRRDLPWRRRRDPYAVWVSEIMLQQTQVNTVIPYFERFMTHFPTVDMLADAPLEQVLSLWKGLGYYARARNLHRGAQYVVQHHAGLFPEQLEAALKVPGVGRYTAGAILSLAYEKPVSLLDGNVARVYARLLKLPFDPKQPAGMKAFQFLADTQVPRQEAGPFNEALMELGATVCTPLSPSCSRCPVQGLCQALAAGETNQFPVKGTRKERPDVFGVALLVASPAGILVAQRPAEGLLGGLWELPTLIRSPEEPWNAAAARVGQERLGLAQVPLGTGVEVEHIFTHLRLVLQVFPVKVDVEGISSEHLLAPVSLSEARRRGTEAVEVRYQALRWVSREGLEQLPMGVATTRALELLLKAPPPQLGLFEVPVVAEKKARTSHKRR